MVTTDITWEGNSYVLNFYSGYLTTEELYSLSAFYRTPTLLLLCRGHHQLVAAILQINENCFAHNAYRWVWVIPKFIKVVWPSRKNENHNTKKRLIIPIDCIESIPAGTNKGLLCSGWIFLLKVKQTWNSGVCSWNVGL